jgi:hypothetical protein
MRKLWRDRAGWAVAVVIVTAALILPVADGIAAPTGANAAPAKLVGRWTRTVTAADQKRTDAFGIPPGSVCTLTIKTSGVGLLVCTKSVGRFDGLVVPAGTNRVHLKFNLSLNSVTPQQNTPNVYRWRVSGRLLTFTKISDSILDRITVFWGVWKRN